MINKDLKVLGKRIQKVRRRHKITQEKLSEVVGINTKYLSNIETGRDTCSFIVLLELANALNVSMDYLLGDLLRYNSNSSHPQSEAHNELLYEFNALSEQDCEHLLKYLALMREYREAK